MNSMERILGTLAGKPVDRRAVAPVLSLYGARLSGCPLRQYYTDPTAYARGQALVREAFEPDVLFGPFAFALIGEALGSALHWFADQAPNVRRPAVDSAEGWDALTMPDPDRDPRLVYLREAVARMAADQRGEVPIAVPLPPPIDLPILVMGMEAWMETVLFDPAGTRRVMERVTPFFVKLANGLLEAGAAFVVLTCGFASPAVVTREIAAGFARPAMEEALAQVKGPVVLHHGGTRLLPHLDLILEMPHTVGFAMDPSDDLDRARQIAGPEAVLLAGPSGPQMERTSAGEIERECQAMLRNRRGDHRFILNSGGPDIPWNTPPENILALRHSAEACAREEVK